MDIDQGSMQSGSIISNFCVVFPTHRLSQADALQCTIQAHLMAESAKLSKTGQELAQPEKLIRLIDRYYISERMIGTRWTDFCEPDGSYRFLSQEHPSGASIEERTVAFGKRADTVLRELYDQVHAPSHILHVTCTGYQSPSAVQKLVADRRWSSTGITHAYHMGCYAALPAVRLADALIQSGEREVDIVHTEMCTLHMDMLAHEPEQIVVQSLFADGHIKYTLSRDARKAPGLKVLTTLERIVPDSVHDMGWAPASWGMRMNLSREVPAKIRDALEPFLKDLLKKADISTAASPSKENFVFAVHPGGPKIIDAVQETLGVREAQLEASRQVLFERGNMSSATLPHVWERILARPPRPGTHVISLAFGPGLTMFGSVFEVVGA